MMWKLVIICSFLVLTLRAQTETGYWGKTEISYEIENTYRQRDYTFRSSGITEFIAEAFTKSYWLLISDLDGDNCPFRPSCSEFFQESVKKTNIVQGTLMFFDRFTRDLNFINRHHHYDMTPEGYFYDPPERYIF